MGRLGGKVAIVTGAASGIGRASATLFAREGARVVIVDRNVDGLSATADIIAKNGGSAEIVAADASDEDEVKAFTDRAVEKFAALDVVFANAGIIGGPEPLLDQSAELWRHVLQVNLIGPFLAIKYAGPYMIKQGRGSVILTASAAGLRANAAGAPYSASKAGVISLAQTAANALFGTGVRVNAICPGLIETGMTRWLFDAARERGTAGNIGQLNPLRRAGTAEEVAAVALFLASEDASYVNGQVVAVDGGLSSTLPFTRPVR